MGNFIHHHFEGHGNAHPGSLSRRPYPELPSAANDVRQFAHELLDRQRSEERCEQLARRGQFLQARGEVVWPDGTVAGRYGFLHALYQNVLYEQLSPGRRVRLHQQIGTLLETAYGTQTQEIAAALAGHFEAGRDTKRAVQYRGQVAQVALRRNALTETLAHLEKGLTLLATLPDSSERAQQELTMQLNLGSAALAAKGLGAPEVGHAFSRARDLAQRMDDSPLNSGMPTHKCLFGLPSPSASYSVASSRRRTQERKRLWCC